MEKKIKLSPNRYELAYHKKLADLPAWKKLVVTEDIKNKVSESRHLTDFEKSVVELAERDAEIFVTAE